MRNDDVQPDLFAASRPAGGGDAPRCEVEAAPIRREVEAVLATARAAARLPWDPTTATVLEIRVAGQCRLLPEAEGEALREAFFAELDRLYAAG